MAIITNSGSSMKMKTGEDGNNYLKIKVQIDTLTPKKLRLIATLIEKVEKDEIDRGRFHKFWKDLRKFSLRYLVGNVIKTIFQIATILISVKYGADYLK